MTSEVTAPQEDEDSGDDQLAELPNFHGLPDIIDLVQDLSLRPSFGEAPRGRTAPTTGRHRGIPMVCLVREQQQDALLPHLHTMLHKGAIPCATNRFPTPPPDTGEPDLPEPPVDFAQLATVAAVLDSIARQLSSGVNSSLGRVRFRRFDLIYWLMKQQFPVTGDADHQLRSALRKRDLIAKRDRSLRKENDVDAVAARAPWWVEVILRFLPPFVFRAKIRGLIPGAGAEYRWLPRQRYLAPRDPGTFIGLAERLAGAIPRRPNNPENPEELIKLLVNAFLEDIRHAYRRGPLRPLAGKRTAYTVVLLDNITKTNSGYLLLKMINVVRNDTGAFDPLLVISGSRKVPPDAKRPGASRPSRQANEPIRQANEAHNAYQDWCGQFSGYSRARKPTAWYLPLQIPPPTSDQLGPLPILSVQPAPLWSRKSVLALAALLLVMVVAAISYLQVRDIVDERDRLADEQLQRQLQFAAEKQREKDKHCGLETSHSDWGTLNKVGGECVGISTRQIPLDASGEKEELARFNEVQSMIATQNDEAVQKHNANLARRYATIVYVSAMSAEKETLVSNTERLMGVASAQRRALDNNSGPLIRVLLANAGSRMQHGEHVAGLLEALLAKDSSIVAVVGLAQSRQATTNTIQALDRIGLPMIAATLSGDQVAGNSRLYFQVSPQNARQAEVAARYASERLQVDHVRIVYSADDTDTYSTNLAADADRSFKAAGFTIGEPVRYDPNSPPAVHKMGAQLCADAGKLIFFAGRPEPFGQILDGINDSCRDRPPRILAGDDVSRYVADDKLRTRYAIPFDYMSFAVGNSGCEGRSDLYTTMNNLFSDECKDGRNPSLDGHAALAYDALNTTFIAIKNLTINNPKPVHVALQIGLLKDVNGESGLINFDNPQNPNIPKDKFIAVLQVKDRNAPTVAITCGESVHYQTPAEWCPRTS